MNERFDLFMSQLSETNSTLESLTDFEKVGNNTHKIAIKLNQLNYLLGKDNLREAIEQLYEENASVFSVLGILVAVRTNKLVLNAENKPIDIKEYFSSVESIYEFILDTGLSEVFISKKVTNLVDYVFGVEVGLDTNARKNRGGTIMEKRIAKAFIDAGVSFKEQVSSSGYREIDSLGVDLKRFDFAVETEYKTYLIEANFYNGGGSKLNEVARSYSDVAPKINQYDNFEFVWITDGQGWKSAKNKLEEAFNIIPSIYNLTTLDSFIENILKK